MTPRPRRQNSSALAADSLTLDKKQNPRIGDIEPKSSSSPQIQTTSQADTLWIFGYGSLCWKPGFEYLNKVVGYVKGYSRKFWQGNTAHRGTLEKPGRVATLIEDKDGEVWGVGYEVPKSSTILEYLWHRECFLGGYHIIELTFYPLNGEGVEGLAYLATPSSPGWLGNASIEETALQIAEAIGPAGPNTEYVCKLAEWIRNNTPVRDPHLELLDILIKSANEESESVLTAREKIMKTMSELNFNNRESKVPNAQAVTSKSQEYSTVPTISA